MGEPAQFNKNKKILQKLRGEPAQLIKIKNITKIVRASTKDLISLCKVSAKPAMSRGGRQAERATRAEGDSVLGWPSLCKVSAKPLSTRGRIYPWLAKSLQKGHQV